SGKLSYTSDEGLSSLPAPSKTGLTFDGWYTDAAFTPANKVTSIATDTTGNVTLYAKWKVTVTFDYNGGKVGSSTSSEDVYDYASTFSSIKPSTNPTKSHAAFKHWSTVSDGTGSAVSGTASVTTSTTYYAIWDSTEIIYESPIELNTNFTSNTGLFKDYTPGTAYTLPGPTYTGLTFAGWYYEEDFSGSEVIAIPATATGEQKLYAKWTATVTFDTQGGSSVSSRTVIYNKKVSKPSNPTKSQRAFLGWYTSEDGGTTLASEAYNFNTAVTQNLTLYAKWGLDISGLSSYLASLPEGSKEAPNVLPAISGLTKDNWKQISSALKANETKFVDLSATTLPSDITDMMYGFQLCKTLVVAPAIPAGVTILERCFYGCENLTVAPEIPNKVWDMCNAFQWCSSLTTAPEIPSSVTNMKYCFSRCTSLSGEIVVNALITDSAKWADAFEQVPASVIIKVKSESVKNYISSTGDSHTVVVEP
ncbi:MAG: InlB B-repeat-containing protein, partial [Treponema sp.]|nr:InlB B-repeat-containing protein [Treponema sp.]